MNGLFRSRSGKLGIALLIFLLAIQCCVFVTTDSAYAEESKDTYIIIDADGETQTVDLSVGEAANMTNDENVQCIEKDFIIEAPVEEEWDMVKPVSSDWNLRAINADGAIPGQKMKVAVLDSGVDMTDNIDVKVRQNFIADKPVETPLYEDLCGHGTSVASIIAGSGVESDVQGVGRNIELYSARVLDENKQAPVSRVVEAIYWAIEQNVDIINISFGTQTYSEALKTAIEAAEEKGILVIAAAGNHGNSNVDYPAAFDGVLAVGSTNAAGEISAFSSRGERIDVVAPGEAVLAQGNFGEDLTLSGTSLAAPHVTGVAALLWSKDTEKPATFIKTLIKLSAKNLGVTGSGFGLVDYDYALELYDEVAAQFEDIATGKDNNDAAEEIAPPKEEPLHDVPGNEDNEDVDTGSETQNEPASELTDNEGQSLAAQSEDATAINDPQQDNMAEVGENTPIEGEQAKPEIDTVEGIPDINSKEFEAIAIEQIDVVENTARAEDLSDPIVDGSWGASIHGMHYANQDMKAGALISDTSTYLAKMKTNPEFHGYSWHGSPEKPSFSTGTCNYFANYKYLVLVAMKGDGDHTGVAAVQGLSSTCRNRMETGITNIKKTSAYKNASNKKAFLMGIAMHTAADIFAHSSFKKSGSSWVIIQHPDADEQNVINNRVNMAYHVMQNVVERQKGNRSGINYCHDLHDEQTTAYYTNVTFKINKMQSFAQAAGITNSTILGHFGKIS